VSSPPDPSCHSPKTLFFLYSFPHLSTQVASAPFIPPKTSTPDEPPRFKFPLIFPSRPQNVNRYFLFFLYSPLPLENSWSLFTINGPCVPSIPPQFSYPWCVDGEATSFPLFDPLYHAHVPSPPKASSCAVTLVFPPARRELPDPPKSIASDF